jgi:hypothetical protein
MTKYNTGGDHWAIMVGSNKGQRYKTNLYR